MSLAVVGQNATEAPKIPVPFYSMGDILFSSDMKGFCGGRSKVKDLKDMRDYRDAPDLIINSLKWQRKASGESDSKHQKDAMCCCWLKVNRKQNLLNGLQGAESTCGQQPERKQVP